MKISALRLFNVRRFAGRGVAIEGIRDGVNVLCAANESGKSTSFEALHALFFQPYSGTPGEIQRLRPYSGGSPLVEADVITAQGRFRLTKQYYAGKSARVMNLTTGQLVAQADEAENFIASLIGSGASGPAGLLWVRQGVTGVEKRPKSEEDNEKQVRANLLESVQGEVEAVTGGRRMAEIIANARDALDELVTKKTGSPKQNGPYAAALAAKNELAAAEQNLARDVEAMREALDAREKYKQRLVELDDPEARARRSEALAKAQATFDAATAQAGRLGRAQAELELARAHRDAARKPLVEFREARAKAEGLREKITEAQRRADEADANRTRIEQSFADARDETEAAKIVESDARELLARLDAALRARDASERLEELKQRLEKCDGFRRTIEESSAQLALLKISPESVEALQQLDNDIAAARAAAAAARPTVSIVYDQDDAALVTMDGTPLLQGERRSYESRAQLVAPGIGTLTLRSNPPATSDKRLEADETKRRKLIDALGVENLAQARERLERARLVERDIVTARASLEALAPEGLQSLRENIAAIEPVGPDALELKGNAAEIRASHERARERQARADASLRELAPQISAAGKAYVEAQKALAVATGQHDGVAALLGPEDQRGAREAALAQECSRLETEVANAEAAREKIAAESIDLAGADAALRRASSVCQAAEKEAGDLREKIAGLDGEIRVGASEAIEEKWQETREALAAAVSRVDKYRKEVAVLQRLVAALDDARSQARDLYLAPVVSELKPLLGLLFDDVAIEFDEKTLLPESILRNGLREDVDRLSGGMREQLSVLTRLAFARLLARDGRPAPVILDDALVYSDDDRIERMFVALHRQARDQQIIVFSCRQRAFTELGGNVLEMTDWTPPQV